MSSRRCGGGAVYRDVSLFFLAPNFQIHVVHQYTGHTSDQIVVAHRALCSSHRSKNTHAHTMDSPGDVSTRRAATPSKASDDVVIGAAAVSTPNPGFGAAGVEMIDVSSPDPASFSFARQTRYPPALSTKPKSTRKVGNLFSGGSTAASAGASIDNRLGNSIRKSTSSASAARGAPGGSYCSSWHDDPDNDIRSPGKDAAQTWDSQSGGGSSDSAGLGFTSPVRKSRPGAASSRFTPQRNLVALFASPLPLPPPTQTLLSLPSDREDGAVVATTLPAPATAADPVKVPDSTNVRDSPPLLLLSPEREEMGAGEFANNENDIHVCIAAVSVNLPLCVLVAFSWRYTAVYVRYHTPWTEIEAL